MNNEKTDIDRRTACALMRVGDMYSLIGFDGETAYAGFKDEESARSFAAFANICIHKDTAMSGFIV